MYKGLNWPQIRDFSRFDRFTSARASKGPSTIGREPDRVFGAGASGGVFLCGKIEIIGVQEWNK